MSCGQIISGGKVIGHVCRTETERRVLSKRRTRKWCFKCRTHALHAKVGHFPPVMSYYEAYWTWECPTCKGDFTEFPSS